MFVICHWNECSFFILMVLLVNRDVCEFILSISNLANVGICLVIVSMAVLLSIVYTSDDFGYEFSSRVYFYVTMLYVESTVRVYSHFAVISEA